MSEKKGRHIEVKIEDGIRLGDKLKAEWTPLDQATMDTILASSSATATYQIQELLEKEDKVFQEKVNRGLTLDTSTSKGFRATTHYSEKTMEISPEKKAKIDDWLNDRWPPENRDCPLCNHNDWSMAPYIMMDLECFLGGFDTMGWRLPLVALVCNHCSHTLYFNAKMMGVVKDEEENK